MTAPAARTLAEIVAEGRRLERPNEPGPKGQRAVFWAEHASLFLAVAEAALKIRKTLDVLEYAGTSPRLSADIAAFDALAVADAAVEWEAAAEKFCAPKATPLRSLFRRRMIAAEATLRAAVRGEEKKS